MSSIGVNLPITQNSGNGFTTIKTIRRMVKQNLKMLILTIPGERVMIPDYGVGLSKYLFEFAATGIQSDIQSRIEEQVARYLPIVRIIDMTIAVPSDAPNSLSVQLVYNIPNLNTRDMLEITI